MNKSGKLISIKTTSIKEIIKENHIEKISLLKMDCVGTEYEIFID